MTVPELFDPAANNGAGGWTLLPNLQRQQYLYPYMFVLPDGNLIDAGPGNASPDPDTADQDDNRVLVRVNAEGVVLPPALWTWGQRVLAPPPFHPTEAPGYAGSAAMWEPGKIVRCGGQETAIATTWTLDASTVLPPFWSPGPDMYNPRKNHNLVVLPDGKVLAIGGNTSADTAGGVYEVEIFDPVAGTWTRDASSDPTQGRWYHSTAMLLQDGRVVSAGGRNVRTGQIYKPPYINILGTIRTSIVSAPAYMQYGQQYQVRYNTNNGPTATRACLMRPAATTHGFDQDQRRVPLEIVLPSPLEDFEPLSGPSSLRVRAPVNANVAPPGYYMLFIMSEQAGQWVPCDMAAWVRVGP